MNVKFAGQFFSANPKFRKYCPEGQIFKNALVKYEKDGNVIKKIVTRKNGNEVIGFFKNGKLFQSTFESKKGKITIKNPSKVIRNFLRFEHVKKTITIKLQNGDKFTRNILNSGAFYDTWHPKNEAQYTGRMVTLYQKLMSKIKG